ncbi:transglycosylase SLT domain-containing protein [Nocardia vermiculata]|uniref:Transglycosylase SLT domain-containing protein n=1 Tax=Nocardia vermiculata TaxID=257274 RepID=A0A846XXJ4_9NOCA|nr:transglycosylase SLT domain-containing protein [Nocardia vermiculata]NKY48929.1 transglycosylase SLT domain-containing protein [Nocardia vermiculata]
MSKTTSSRTKAAARTAGSATLAFAAFAAITSAGGHKSDDVKPVALASEIAATADKNQPAEAAPVEAVAAAAPAPAPAPVEAIPAPMPAPEPVQPPPPPVYPDNLDGWIHNALDIMSANGIPGSYDGILRNVLRESSGNPQAINLYDINAMNGIPSKGLLQVIPPTFEAYHVDGTSWDIWDPVANIVAACNYAAHRYGSMDNVDSAY